MTPATFWLLMLLATVLTVAETAERKKARVLPKGKKTDSKLSNFDGKGACSKIAFHFALVI